MDPVLVQLGPLAIRWYGLLIALGVLAGSVWSLREARRRDMDTDALLDMAPWLVLAGLVGARLVFVLTSPGRSSVPEVARWTRSPSGRAASASTVASSGS